MLYPWNRTVRDIDVMSISCFFVCHFKPILSAASWASYNTENSCFIVETLSESTLLVHFQTLSESTLLVHVQTLSESTLLVHVQTLSESTLLVHVQTISESTLLVLVQTISESTLLAHVELLLHRILLQHLGTWQPLPVFWVIPIYESDVLTDCSYYFWLWNNTIAISCWAHSTVHLFSESTQNQWLGNRNLLIRHQMF